MSKEKAQAFFEKKMSVFGGEQYRPLLHVKDVARAIEIAIRSKKRGVFNLSYKNMRIIDIAKEIQKYFKNTKIIKTQIKFQDARNYHALSQLISKIKPQVVIQLAAVSHANKSNKDPYSTFDHSLRTLENTLDYIKKKIIGAYYPYNYEIDTLNILKKLEKMH